MDSEFYSLDDFLEVPADEDGAARKYKPKAKGRPKPRSSVVPSTRPNLKHVVSSPTVLETAQENLAEVTDLTPPRDSISIGGSDTLNNADGPHSRVLINQGGLVSFECLTVSQEVVAVCDGRSKGDFLEDLPVSGGDDCQNITEQQHLNTTENAGLLWDPFDDIDLGQPTSAANEVGKFQPKLKYCPVIDTRTSAKSSLSRAVKDNTVDFFSDGSDSNGQKKLSATNVSGNNDMPESSHQEEVLCDKELMDAPSIILSTDDYFSRNEHSLYGSEIGRPGASLPDDDVHVETALDIHAERVDDSVSAEGVGTRKPPRVPRKRKARSTQPNEAVDGEHNDLEGELHYDSVVGQDISNNNIEGDTNLKKKGVKRSRKSAPDDVQQTRSRKKVNHTSDEQSEKPKKKFSHSTRGRKKRVDPTFLATPDDEIDHTNVPLKDLILRAEFLERESKKVASPPSTPAVVHRFETPSPLEEQHYDLWNNVNNDSDLQEEYDDPSIEINVASSYFNYHSHMKRTPRVAWSKLDTEVFYQGIRQFGTDFSLIQQLFPGRTRDQIKSKYKKEEKQHPQRITEAIENRASGVSHFQQVIDQLKAAEVQENQELSDDQDGAEANEESIQEATADLIGNSSERLEQDDMVAKDDPEALDATEIQESDKLYEEDDDHVFGWDYSSLL